MSLILASGSPRRKELLSFITSDFEIRVSNAPEKVNLSLAPDSIVMSLAEQKADAVLPTISSGDVLISADTVVFIDGKILGKPHSEKEAFEMLSEMSGNRHTVFTGVCIADSNKKSVFVQSTEVEFYPLTTEEINAYIASGEPFDKAGGYGIQGKGAMLVKSINGDFYNVMGFPVALVDRKLKEFYQNK